MLRRRLRMTQKEKDDVTLYNFLLWIFFFVLFKNCQYLL